MKIEFKNMQSASKRIVANGSLRVTHVYKRLCFLGPYGGDPFASSLEFALMTSLLCSCQFSYRCPSFCFCSGFGLFFFPVVVVTGSSGIYCCNVVLTGLNFLFLI